MWQGLRPPGTDLCSCLAAWCLGDHLPALCRAGLPHSLWFIAAPHTKPHPLPQVRLAPRGSIGAKLQVNNRGSAQASLKVRSTEHQLLALVGLVPIFNLVRCMLLERQCRRQAWRQDQEPHQ
jgi:hypothetical protein